MLNTFSSWLDKHIGKKQLIILFICYVAIVCVMGIVFIPLIRANSGTMTVFDLQAKGYTAEYAKAFLAAMGDSGKNIYLKAQLPLDFIYPVVYTLFYSGLAQKIFKKHNLIIFVSIGVLCVSDYTENVLTYVMLLSNELSAAVVGAASFFTVLKTAFLYIVVGMLVLGALYRFAKKIKKHATEQI